MKGSRRIKRLGEIERKRRHPFWLIVLFIIPLILLSLYGTYRLLRHLLTVEKIVVRGNQVLSEEEIKKIAGLREDVSILEIDTSRVYHRLLGSPWIKEAVVRKELPERLIIWLEEATPEAIINRDGRLFLIDDQGVLLEELRKDSHLMLPVIEIDYRNTELIKEALLLIRALKESNMAPASGSLYLTGSRKEDLTIVLRKDSSKDLFIKVGYGKYNEKLKRLLDFAPSIKEKGLRPSVIDLRFEDRVIVKESLNG